MSEALGSAFDAMDVAEEEIDAGKLRHPDKADMIHCTFGVIRPRFELEMLKYAEEIYRGHCRELIDRAATSWDGKRKKIDLTGGTRAELCIMMCVVSLTTPIQSIYTSIYLRSFTEIFGFNPVAGEDIGASWATQTDARNWIHHESWDGEAFEMEARLRHKLRQEWRVMKFNDDRRRWVIEYKK